MSVEIASLLIEIDATQAERAEKALDKLTAAGGRAESAAQRIKAATDKVTETYARSVVTYDKAAQGANAYAAAEAKIERATQGSTAASASTRAARALEAAAMRELVQATNAYERDQARAAKTAVAAAREQAQALASLEQRIHALKSALDPTYAAQSRLDAEMREATALYKMGAISASDYAARVAQLDTQMAAAARGHTMLNGVMVRGAGSAKFMQRAGLDLSRQFADIGVTAAMGMNPLMILIQQGPQIADIFAQGKAQGVGFGAMLKMIAAQAAPLLAILGPLLLVVGAAGAAFALFNRELNKGATSKELIASLGLTEEQLKRVKKETITFGDTMKATFNVLGRYVMDSPLGDAIRSLRKDINAWLDEFAKNSVKEVGVVVGAFIGAYEGIKAVWKNLPAVLGDAVTTTANVMVKGIEWAINKAIDGINRFGTQAAAMLLGGPLGALLAPMLKGAGAMPTLQHVDLGARANPNAGAVANVGAAVTAGFERGVAATTNAASKFLSDVSKEREKIFLDRVREKAGDPNKGAATPRDQTDERAAQLAAALAGAKADELQATLAITRDVHARADIERQILASQVAEKQAQVDRQIANIADDKGLSAARKAELTLAWNGVKAQQAATGLIQQRAIDDAEFDAAAKQALDIATAQRAGQADILQSQLGLATTAAQRGAIEMRLLDLADQQARAQYEGVIAAKGSTAAQVEIAKTQLATLEATRGAREEAQRRKTAIAGADEIITELGLIDSLAAQAGNSLESAFGRAGGALGQLVTSLSGFRLQMAQIDRDVLSRDKTEAQGAREKAALQIRTYGDMASAAKGFFKEGSKGYKAMETAEKVYRAFEFAMAVKSLFLKSAEITATGAGVAAKVAAVGPTVAADAATAASGTAAGAGKIFAALGPFGFPVVAAMLAVMAGLGIAAFSGGGGGPNIDVAEDRQKTQGTGSVLGDAAAKSESIAHALDLVAANTNRDLEYSNGMLRALRSIDQNIGALTDVLARQLGVGGALSTSGLNLGTATSGPSLLTKLLIGPIAAILPGLFGKTKTTTLLDQGLAFDPQSLDAILNGGLSGDSYQDIQTQTKKKFFGITYSNKTKTSTQTTPLGDDILAEMQRVIGSLKEGVLQAAGALGVEGADAALAAFTVNLGTISFKDKTGQEIQDELNAVFGKLGDELSAAVFPAISEFQKAGEGAFETLVRVARQTQVVDVSLRSIGMTLDATGISGIRARDGLVKLFGSLDDFVEQTQFFAENFLSAAEQIAPVQAAVVKEFQRLGVTGVNTKDAFKALVLGLDLSTAAGAEMYAALLAIAPAFAKVFDFLTEGSKDVEDATNALAKAYERESKALQSTIDKFNGFADSLRKFRDSLDTGPNVLLSPEAQYFATQARFTDTAAKARLGDETALGDLQGVSQAYLDASKAYFASSTGYFQDLAAVKAAVEAAEATATRTASNATQQLDALKASVSGLLKIDEDVISVRDAILALRAAMGAQQVAQTAAGTPFSPATSATGSTAPSYTYQPATTPTSTTPAPVSYDPSQYNWASYLTHYADVNARADQGVVEGWIGAMGQWATKEAWAQYQWFNSGEAEGRTPFDTGGSFTVGGSGPQDFGPATFHGGEIVNVRRPGDVANDNAEVVAELKALRAETAALRATVARGFEADVTTQEKVGVRVERAVARPSTADLRAGGKAR